MIGGWHLVWSILVLLGWAQPIIDFIFWAHMIQPVYIVKPFNPLAAVTLIGITALVGYIFGYIGAIIWNKLHRPQSARDVSQMLAQCAALKTMRRRTSLFVSKK